jgi:hypothetical protein
LSGILDTKRRSFLRNLEKRLFSAQSWKIEALFSEESWGKEVALILGVLGKEEGIFCGILEDRGALLSGIFKTKRPSLLGKNSRSYLRGLGKRGSFMRNLGK